MKHIFLFFVCFFCNFYLVAQKQVDSLRAIINTPSARDTTAILAKVELANLYRYNKADSSLLMASQALTSSKQLNYAKGAGRASRVIGIYHREKGNLKTAIEFLEVSVEFCKEINDLEGLGFAYNSISAIYRKEANYSLATEYCLKALSLFELSKNKTGEAYVLNQLGTICGEQGNYEQGMKYLQRSLVLDQQQKSKIGIYYTYFAIAELYRLQQNHEKALEYQLNNLALAEELKNNYYIIYACNNIGLSYIALKKYELALPYLQKGLPIAIQIQNLPKYADISATLAQYYNVTNQPQQALKYAKIALDVAKKSNDFGQIGKSALEYSTALANLGNYKEAFIAHQLHKQMVDTLSSQESQRKVLAKEYAYIDEKKKLAQQQKDVLHAKELEKQTFYMYALLIGFLSSIGIGFFIIRMNRQKHKTNALLQQKNNEISSQHNRLRATLDLVEQQKRDIQAKSENITASIMYAQHIQQAMLPFEEQISQGLGKGNYFILYKPRDIVSGDFYFYEEIKEKTIIAVGDCTGHGVPGAFMSMIGNQILTEVIVKNRLVSPEKILNILHHEIRRTLKQNLNLESTDGMDIAIISMSKPENGVATLNNSIDIEYAGAMNPMFIVQNNEILETKADKKPIGGQQYKDEVERLFTKKTVTLSTTQQSTLYLFTDGYQDQFGGEKGKKFMTKRFRELLLKIHHETMPMQKQLLDNMITQWIQQGHETQTDDITVMGIRIV